MLPPTSKILSGALICMVLSAVACSHDLDPFGVPDLSVVPDKGDAAQDVAYEDNITAPDRGVDLGCTPPEIPCGSCVNPTSDDNHCGGCNSPCPANTSCNSSVCDCLTGFDNCDSDGNNGCEADLANDDANCGKCGKKCSVGYTCNKSACVCDPTATGACGGTDLYCSKSLGICQTCDKGKFNCDQTGGCECIGKCVGASCDTTCTYGATGQCGSIYHACLSSGKCAMCPAGIKNCDRRSGCGTPESEPCL